MLNKICLDLVMFRTFIIVNPLHRHVEIQALSTILLRRRIWAVPQYLRGYRNPFMPL